MTKATTTISKDTLNILKNFSGINSNLYVKPGSKITTMSPTKNIMAEVEVEESFDTEFGIWDLNKLLGVVSLFQDPEFIFDDKYMTITGASGSKVKYFYSDPKLLSYPTKSIKKIDAVVEFDLTSDDFRELSRAGAVLQNPDLCFVSDDDAVLAVVKDLKDPTCNVFSIRVGDNKDQADFSFNFKLENMKMFDGDYHVALSKNVIGQFTHASRPLTYWVAMDATSTYKE
jgi:hypothetical protein